MLFPGARPGSIAFDTCNGCAGALIPPDVRPGNYYFCAQIDPGNRILESDETNNVTCVPIKILGK